MIIITLIVEYHRLIAAVLDFELLQEVWSTQPINFMSLRHGLGISAS